MQKKFHVLQYIEVLSLNLSVFFKQLNSRIENFRNDFIIARDKGFTLIELLVVVLIIGILAAVALPQYTKAVERARATQGKTMVDALLKAEKICQLANGVADGSGECTGENRWNGDLDLPRDSDTLVNCKNIWSSGRATCRQYKDWIYGDVMLLRPGVVRMENGAPKYTLWIEATTDGLCCYPNKTDACKNIGATTMKHATCWLF